MRHIWVNLVWAILMAPPIHASTTEPPSAPVPYQHAGSGFVFPLSVGPFERTAVAEMTPDGLRVAAQYDTDAPGHEMSVSVEIYPAPYILPGSRNAQVETDACTHHATAFDQEMEQEYRARRVDVGTVPSPPSAASGRRSSFIVKRKAGGNTKVETYLFCPVAKEWIISYIANGPAQNDLTADLARFAGWLSWPELTIAPPAVDRRTTIIARSAFGQPSYFLRGVMVTGRQPDIDIFNAAATAQGIDVHAVPDEATPQMIASFDIHTKALSAIDIIRQVRDGKMGALKLELLLLPLSAAKGDKGEIDAIEAAPPNAIDGL